MVRYAVVGTLLRAGRPMTIGELIAALRAAGPVDEVLGPLTPKRMSDALRAQAAQGRVRRVRRGVYEAVPSAMSRTTRWRYRTWERHWGTNLDPRPRPESW